jgi:voltage-gated potassium channel
VTGTFRARRVAYAAVGLVVTLIFGTIGFHHYLGEGWLQAFYRSIVTASLTGLDTVPRNDGARVITMLVVLAGLVLIGYVGAAIVEAIAGDAITGALAGRRRQRAIERLRDHFIICGYGRVGRRVAQEFGANDVPFAVLDFSEDAIAAAKEEGVLFIEGNGVEDEDLAGAGLERARGLVASSDSDADNLYITLSARAANPDLLIVARASNEDASRKLKLAGADRIVQPYQAAGRVMANLLLKPQVTAFVDVVTSAGGADLRFEEIEVTQACGQGGKTIRELEIRKETGALIVALRKRDGTFDTTPTPEALVEVGDVLIAAGTEEELRALEQLFAPRETLAR